MSYSKKAGQSYTIQLNIREPLDLKCSAPTSEPATNLSHLNMINLDPTLHGEMQRCKSTTDLEDVFKVHAHR